MMVDGSPRRIPPPPHQDNNNQEQQNSKTPNDTTATSTSLPPPAESSNVAPSSSAPPSEGAPAVARSGRSRWLKLRHTVQLSQAIAQGHKKPPLKREDSFLKRFSTRQIPDPNTIEGSSRRGADGMVKSPFFGTWRSVVNPDENILFYWLSLLTVCLLYNAWTIIARQAFPELQEDRSIAWYCLDGFTDVVFALDIIFQFRTGYLEQGLMVCESKKLAFHYFKSKSFLMDIVAITPLDLIQFRVGVLPIVRFPRFLKVYRSFRFYYMVESRTIYPNLWRVVNLIHILLLLAHWFGCFYYMLSELEGFVGEWSYRKPVDDYATLSRKYLGSVYWSTLTLTTIGDLATPVTNLQYLFTIVSYLIGVFIFATIVGQVGNVITNRNASRLEFERLLDGAKLYMRHHKVPRNMQRRVQRWYDYSWSRGRMQGGGDINSALGILPDKLKTELALHVNLKTLKKVSIFQECQPEFLHDLVLKMKAYIFTPGDLICRKGEVAREMFIIADGILEVISETGKVLTQMKAGDFFGEIGILNLDGFNRRTADVRSVGYSELFSLSREDILAAMKDYPEAQAERPLVFHRNPSGLQSGIRLPQRDILQTMGRKRLMEARLAANVGKSGANTAEANLPSTKKGQSDGGRKGALKSRTAVSKLKEDVRSLKKLLRSRSTPTGKSGDSEENVEMKPIPASREKVITITEKQPGRRNASIRKLMRRMHLKGEDGSSGVKVLTGRLASSRSKPGRLIGESPSISTESSADSATPLNKGLPLLQRVRMLGEQERRAAATQGAAPTSPQNGANAPSEIIGEGLPFLERLKLLRAKEQAQAAAAGNGKQTSPKNDRNAKPGQSTLKVETQQKPLLSPKSKHNPFSSLLTSAIPAVSTSPKLLPKVPSPKKETISDGKRSPVGLKARIPEFSTELPLLKKVLLMKMMEDKKTDGSNNATQADIQGANSSAAQAQEDSNGRGSDKNGADASNKNDNATASQDLDPDRVYLEQFSRTLGFHMSQLSEDTPKPQPRARLNALSNTPSPTKENVNPVDSLKEQDTSNKKESKRKSPQPQSRKARLSRMMAVREDSDENSTADDDEDPFVKSTECQTEHFEALRSTSTSPDSVSGREGKIRNPELEDGIQDYLLKVMKNVKHAMKAYVIEQQQQLQKRIIQLEKDSREKDELIKKLRSRLEHQSTRPSSTFDEVSSLEVSSLSSSDADERENTFIENQHGQAEEEDEDEDRDLDDEEIRILQQKLSVQRKSWPSSVNIRRMRLPCTRQSYSLDDEQQIIDISKPEEMWRLEFPAPPSQLPISLRVSPQEPVFETIPERLNEDLPLASEEEEENEDKIDENFPDETLGKSCSAGNDWEVRMLVQQFEQNVRQQSRRHSSGEVLTWDRVLNLRKIASRAEKKSPEKVRSRTGRKYSLIEEGSLRQWAASGSSSGMAQSTSFTSLMGPDSRHGSSTTASGRTVPKSARRKSCGQHKRQEPPSGRKNSLPILPHCSSIGMSRWLSMDDAKSEGCRSHDSSLHTSMSSEYSQETVIGVDSRFSSVDDVRPSEGATLGTRSPSSPNVVTDREPQTSFAFSAASALPEWPSSPCLPTIREDEQSIGAVVVPSASSPCRSLSHDCLPQMSLSTLVGQYHRSGASLKRQTESFHEPRTFSAMPYRRASASDSKVSDLRSRTQSGTNVSLDSKWFSNGKPTTSSSGSRTTLSSLELVRNNQSLSQSSVVIAIPEYEPLLSP